MGSASDRTDVAVVGAGISGLTTAFLLERSGLRTTVLEASPRVGGVMQTVVDGPWIFEQGPHSVLENNDAIRALIDAAGLRDEELLAADAARKRYIWKGDRLVPLPSNPLQFLATPLFPLRSKLGLLREPWIRPRHEEADESIADFTRRRLSQAFLDYAVGPFISGVYAGDPERLSVRWATPKIDALEREHGSLIRGALAKRKGPAPSAVSISFPQGLERLPHRLAERLSDVRTGVLVQRVERGADGFRVLTDAGELPAARVVLSLPAGQVADLLDAMSAGRSRAFAEIPYAPIAVISLGFERSAVRHPLDAFGFLAPRRESLRILGCLFTSSTFPGRQPQGLVNLSAFVGGRSDPDIVAWPEARILEETLADLDRALGLADRPVCARVRRWPTALPQYELGHGRFVELARNLESTFPGLHIVANFIGGASVPYCIENATRAARRIAAASGIER